MPDSPEPQNIDLLVPSLREALNGDAVDETMVWPLAILGNEEEGKDPDQPSNESPDPNAPINYAMDCPNKVVFVPSSEPYFWEFESIHALFRGDQKPPSLEQYPAAYVPFFSIVETAFLVYCEGFAIPTDDSMRGLYNNLKRLPDAKPRTPLHDHMRKACALALGMRPWSKAEYEIVLNRLERSCRTFRTSPGSKNYHRHIYEML
jgi:hypothetical protein